MYRVVKFFTDLQDSEHAYNVGDVFPREGKTVSDSRYFELSTSNNKQGVPLIEVVADEVKDDESTKDEVISDDAPIADAEREYTEDTLSDLTTREIKTIAEQRGYKITKLAKNDVIEQFLKQQG